MTKSEHNSMCHGFAVEARTIDAGLRPIRIGDQTFDHEWRTVEYVQSPVGVPDGMFCPMAKQYGYRSFASAMALGYWLLAAAEYGLEFRLVQAKIETVTTITREEETEPFGDRRGLMKKVEP